MCPCQADNAGGDTVIGLPVSNLQDLVLVGKEMGPEVPNLVIFQRSKVKGAAELLQLNEGERLLEVSDR